MGSVSQWKQRKLSYKCHKPYPEDRKGKGDGEGSKEKANEAQLVRRIMKYKWVKASSISEATRSLRKLLKMDLECQAVLEAPFCAQNQRQ